MRTLIKFLLLCLLGGAMPGCSGPHLYESAPPTEAEKAAAAAKKRAEAPNPAYEKYLGKYKMQQPTPGFAYLTIARDGSTLVAQPNENESFELYPLKEDEFDIPKAAAKISFVRSGNASVGELVLALEGKNYRGIKE
jgi:hypothetical protein